MQKGALRKAEEVVPKTPLRNAEVASKVRWLQRSLEQGRGSTTGALRKAVVAPKTHKRNAEVASKPP